eukprot:9301983-Lingulodinium_polyedra.AAC.1
MTYCNPGFARTTRKTNFADFMVCVTGTSVEQTTERFQRGPWPGHTARADTNSSCRRCGSIMN